MLGALLALALSQAADGGAAVLQPRAVPDVKLATIQRTDGGVLTVTEGCWLDSATCITSGERVRRLEAENQALRTGPPVSPVAVIVTGAVCLLVGAGLGVYATCRVAGCP